MARHDGDLDSCLSYNPQPGFSYNDIEEILANVPGEADGPDWNWIVRLKDQRYFLITGGCDYTGWD